MPLFDYYCEGCKAAQVDVLVARYDEERVCPVDDDHGPMRRLPSAAAFSVKGFSARNLYAGGQVKEVKSGDKHVKVEVRS